MVPSSIVKLEEKLIVKLMYDQDAMSPSDGDQTWDVFSFNSRHVNYKKMEELMGVGSSDDARKEFNRKRRKGLAFVLSCYEHGGVAWSMHGEGTRCDFDTTDVAGVMIFNGTDDDMPKGRKRREKDARAFLRTYTAWVNGECYGFAVEEPDGEDVESCWGFIGPDLQYMFDEIAEVVGGRPVEWRGEAKDLAMYHSIELKIQKPHLRRTNSVTGAVVHG